ncbi:SctC family type III secretion system outer membrane ring subunit BsaO [Burkholderia pseudomallei]|uniref:SctC family type III secretion system outer membrane ring subunit BsaO n=1 Tax=Burkholderia pseudomallei TaxID=28450 RepID=UPI000A1A01C2|nr:SctC family type III secretion system outer membrane ring subunit BsaO [Burkholderia pseudomallei]ARK47553.1 EscC/YscC/HrcC family type III secretion system outer membrane ring protein [Burkholderia pseudomallei]ARK73048.1 EscC/YscC/HrcC family type III secretion system outer membrane ring protein [Burkholderia pseudomallei]ARL19828.1 EscC/YscC/HrcC family type III secretion system outer membrane ring protein [Burkholderia pseudomallei]ARL26801.1 EscC/YscC/HrcC family type III secretion syst
MMYADTARRYAAALAASLLMTGAAFAAPTDAAPLADAPAAASATPDARDDDASRVAAPPARAPQDDERHFVANDASISVLLNALSGRLHKPIVASEKVRRKHVTGEFDLAQPRALLARLGESMSLLWYDDGASIYIYDNSEIKNAVVSMRHATVRNLRDFIRQTRLYDPRFPVRGDDLSNTFYVTGAPVYVNLVAAAARYLDEVRSNEASDRQVVRVVQLHNSFVVDRQYTLRDKEVDIPGMATVLGRIFGPARPGAPADSPVAAADATARGGAGGAAGKPAFSLADALPAPLDAGNAPGGAGSTHSTNPANAASPMGGAAGGVALPASDGVRAVAYPDTNSVILVGRLDKVQDMEALIRSLDVEKRQIELSLWIIDIRKSRLDQLGIDWQGALNAPGIGVGFNNRGGNVTTLDGTRFLASVAALSQTGDATVISRPIVLTQENVPATFDSNQTFYAKLIGERTVQLDHVTYGTLVNVLPRLTRDGSQVEMIVDIEDGNTDGATSDGQIVIDNNTMPLVNRTEINTVARVPHEMSLLIGGNTRDDVTRRTFRIPGLASIPLIGGLFRGHSDRHEQVVRVFLIQPKLLRAGAAWPDGQPWESGDPADNATLRATVQMLKPYMDDKS